MGYGKQYKGVGMFDKIVQGLTIIVIVIVIGLMIWFGFSFQPKSAFGG